MVRSNGSESEVGTSVDAARRSACATCFSEDELESQLLQFAGRTGVNQKRIFKANWIWREVVAVVVITPA